MGQKGSSESSDAKPLFVLYSESEPSLPNIKPLFRALDSDNDGLLDRDDVQTFMTIFIETHKLDELVFKTRSEEQNETLVDMVTSFWDLNGDGLLDVKEFYIGVKRSPSLIPILKDLFKSWRSFTISNSLNNVNNGNRRAQDTEHELQKGTLPLLIDENDGGKIDEDGALPSTD